MGGKAKAPPPPDYSGIANASSEAAKYQYELGKEQLAWAKEQYGQDSAITEKVVNFALGDSEANRANAIEDRSRYESVYQPIEDQLVSDVKNNSGRYSALEQGMISDAESYNSADRQASEAGRAQANVAQQFDGQRTAALQNLESYGIDPSSTRYSALDAGLRAQQGAAAAAQGTEAIRQTENTGRALRSEALGRGQALRSEAINIGRGMPGQVAQSYGTALQAGNQAVNSTLAQTASGANTMGTGLQWQQGSNQSLGTWSNALTSGYNAQMAQYNANQNSSSGWGSALGMVGGIAGSLMMSDERTKENIQPVGETYDGQKIYRYNYKGDETPQIGLIAQEVEKRHPGAVGEIDGIKGVDYHEATDDAAEQGHFAMGGAVDPGMSSNPGMSVPPGVSPSGGGAIDDVTAKVNVGEFIVPEDTVSWKGEEFFQKLIEQSRKARDGATAKPEMKPAAPSRPSFSSSAGALPVG